MHNGEPGAANSPEDSPATLHHSSLMSEGQLSGKGAPLFLDTDECSNKLQRCQLCSHSSELRAIHIIYGECATKPSNTCRISSGASSSRDSPVIWCFQYCPWWMFFCSVQWRVYIAASLEKLWYFEGRQNAALESFRVGTSRDGGLHSCLYLSDLCNL